MEGEGGSDEGEKWRGIWKEEREFGDGRGEEEQNLYYSSTIKEEKNILTLHKGVKKKGRVNVRGVSGR